MVGKKGKKNKKVLLLSGSQIFPPLSGGGLRSAALARSLGRLGYDVHIYALTGRRREYLERRPSETAERGAGVRETIDRRLIFAGLQFLSYRLHLPDLWLALPLWGFWQPRQLRRLIRTADVVVLDFPYGIGFARSFRGRMILHSHNLEFVRWSAGGLWRRRILAPLVRAVEKKAAAMARAIICCAPEDQRFYARHHPAGSLVLIPNSAGDRDLRRDEEERLRLRREKGIAARTRLLLFIGSAYGPNQEAWAFLSGFIDRHEGELEALDISIAVVGAVGGPPRRRGRLIVTGQVEQIEPWFSAADAGLNLVTSGSGTSVKMFEFMAAGLPVLSTAFGARGLDLEAGRDYVPVQTQEDQLLQVLRNLEAMADLQSRGADLQQRFSDQLQIKETVRQRLIPLLETGDFTAHAGGALRAGNGA